jgi:hypothetical protein
MIKQMRSFLVAQPGQQQYMLFDVVTERGSFFCGLAVGGLNDNGWPCLSEIGRVVSDRLAEYSSLREGGPSRYLVVEVASTRTAKPRVRKAFHFAKPGDAVLFICHDSTTYEEVFKHLNLQTHFDQSLQ